MKSHYIPYFCRENGRKREAACGAWATPREHSAEPTCAACARWLLQEADDELQTSEDKFGADPHDYNR